MARPTSVADVTVFDGRSVRKRRGVLFATEDIEWVGAHARAPKAAGAAREVDGAGKTLMPGLIDVHVHLQFDGSADLETESRDLCAGRTLAHLSTPNGNAAQKTVFMVEWGTPPLEAIRAATANGAELLRLPDVGTLEPGKRADLLLVDGDPVDDPWTLLGRRRTWLAGFPSSDRAGAARAPRRPRRARRARWGRARRAIHSGSRRVSHVLA